LSNQQIRFLEKYSDVAVFKLEKIFFAIRNKLPLLLFLDQDGTFHQEVTYKIVEQKLPPSALKECFDIDAKYQNKHLLGHLNSVEQADWVKNKIDVFCKYNVSKELIHSAVSDLHPRDYSHKLIEIPGQKNTYVVSMAIDYLIKQFLIVNHFEEVNVFANQVLFKNNIISAVDNVVMITPEVKGNILNMIVKKREIPLEHAIVIGDSMGDEMMFKPETLNILVGKNGHHIKNIDLCLRSESFQPLVELLTRCDENDLELLNNKKLEKYY